MVTSAEQENHARELLREVDQLVAVKPNKIPDEEWEGLRRKLDTLPPTDASTPPLEVPVPDRTWFEERAARRGASGSSDEHQS